MNNIQIANETIKITAEKRYEVGGKTIELPDKDYKKVEVISPDDGAALLDEDISKYFGDSLCAIEVTCEDSFAAARRIGGALVMNFANAHKAGGGALQMQHAICLDKLFRSRKDVPLQQHPRKLGGIRLYAAFACGMCIQKRALRAFGAADYRRCDNHTRTEQARSSASRFKEVNCGNYDTPYTNNASHSGKARV